MLMVKEKSGESSESDMLRGSASGVTKAAALSVVR